MTPPTDPSGHDSVRPKWEPATADDLRAFAASFVDQPCWGALVDDYDDKGHCLLRLDVGDRHEWLRPDPRVAPEFEQHRFHGEYAFRETHAPWRLDDLRNGNVLVTSFDAGSELERIKLALHELIDRKITRIEFREPGFDCTIRFDETFELKVFPTIVEPGFPNYRLSHKGETQVTNYSVDAYSSLVVKKRVFEDQV